LRSQALGSLHSFTRLRVFRTRLCSQTRDPPHSLHWPFGGRGGTFCARTAGLQAWRTAGVSGLTRCRVIVTGAQNATRLRQQARRVLSPPAAPSSGKVRQNVCGAGSVPFDGSKPEKRLTGCVPISSRYRPDIVPLTSRQRGRYGRSGLREDVGPLGPPCFTGGNPSINYPERLVS
jgi:hypothetical protein